SFVSVQPARRRPPDVSHAVERTCRNHQLFADRRSKDLSVDFELDLSLENHHDFIDGMSIIFPSLSRRIRPDVATKPARLPIETNPTGVCHGTSKWLIFASCRR